MMEDVKKILEGYRGANEEVERLEKRKERLEEKKGDVAVDAVRGSMDEYPFIERVVKIEGKSIELVNEIQNQIDRRIEEGLKARIAAEEIIGLAEDWRTREILRSRYIDCLPWAAVGKKNNVDPDHARRIVREFIKQIS